MPIPSESEAKKLAADYLDSDHIGNPHETSTRADELYEFHKLNSPSFVKDKPAYWSQWKVLRLIDPEAGDEGICKMSVDMVRYYVERSETDRDYWDALRRIIEKALSASSHLIRRGVVDNLHLSGWMVDVLKGERAAPPRKRGNRARKYHVRDGRIYYAMEALCQNGDGPMSQSAAAAWIAGKINLSKEAIITIYRNACSS